MTTQHQVVEPLPNLCVVETPAYSPHRIFLRGGMTEQFPTGAFTIYWMRERKTGARRGCSPQWVGFDERDRQNLHEISRRWNAYPQLVALAVTASTILDLDFDARNKLMHDAHTLLRELGERI